MKVFPQQTYRIHLYEEVEKALKDFKAEVSIHDGLVSYNTGKTFIGFFKEKGFKVITSVIGKGAFCTFDCSFNDNQGLLEVKIHKAFRILFIVGAVLSLSTIIYSLIIEPQDEGYKFIVLVIGAILLFRLVALELAFKFLQKDGLKKLVLALNIKYIEKL